MIEESALFKITLGVYLLGAKEYKTNRYTGCIIDACMQVSLSPMQVAVSCFNGGYTKECIEKTGLFSLSVLPKDTSFKLLSGFGFRTSRDFDKWQDIAGYELDGLPVLTNSIACLSAKVVNKVAAGDHTLFIADVLSARDNSETRQEKGQRSEPMTYEYYRSDVKDDVKACSVPSPNIKKDKVKGKWVCNLCGHIYDGEVPFEQLPDDWKCPLCCAGKGCFEYYS